MLRRPARAAVCAVLAIIAALAALAAPAARAGQVPVTSLSNATLVFGDLLDQVALTFLYPQHASIHASQVFAIASTETSQEGVGGIASPHHYGIFVGSQSYSRLSFNADQTLHLFQIGLALRAGPVRTGIAVRASRSRTETVRVNAFGPNVSEEQDGATLSYRETAIGLGAGQGDLFIDGEFEVRVEQLLSEDVSTRDSDTRGTRVDAEGKYRMGVAMRAGVHWGRSAALRVAGSWRDLSYEETVETSLRDTTAVVVTSGEIDGHRWDVAMSVQSPEGSVALWRAWASYEDESGPTRWRYGDSRIRAETQRTRAGISLEHDAWWQTRIFGGIRGTWESVQSSESRLSSSGDRLSLERETEGTEHGFAWGASRAFGKVDLIASVSTNLSLSRLFATLDAGFRF